MRPVAEHPESKRQAHPVAPYTTLGAGQLSGAIGEINSGEPYPGTGTSGPGAEVSPLRSVVATGHLARRRPSARVPLLVGGLIHSRATCSFAGDAVLSAGLRRAISCRTAGRGTPRLAGRHVPEEKARGGVPLISLPGRPRGPLHQVGRGRTLQRAFRPVRRSLTPGTGLSGPGGHRNPIRLSVARDQGADRLLPAPKPPRAQKGAERERRSPAASFPPDRASGSRLTLRRRSAARHGTHAPLRILYSLERRRAQRGPAAVGPAAPQPEYRKQRLFFTEARGA
jgi:hypothetical protein